MLIDCTIGAWKMCLDPQLSDQKPTALTTDLYKWLKLTTCLEFHLHWKLFLGVSKVLGCSLKLMLQAILELTASALFHLYCCISTMH